VLNDVFVAGLMACSSTEVSGHVLFSTRVLRSATPVPSAGAFCFPNLFSKLLNPQLFRFISGNSVSSLHESYPLNWCKFLINALSSSLNGTFTIFCGELSFDLIYELQRWKFLSAAHKLCDRLSCLYNQQSQTVRELKLKFGDTDSTCRMKQLVHVYFGHLFE